MEPKVKDNPLIYQYDINTHKFILESDLDSCHPLSSLSNDPFPLDPLDQSLPNPNSDQMKGSHSS